jgi:hypothetical protein
VGVKRLVQRPERIPVEQHRSCSRNATGAPLKPESQSILSKIVALIQIHCPLKFGQTSRTKRQDVRQTFGDGLLRLARIEGKDA